MKPGLEMEKAALLVVVAGLRDGQKQALAVEAGHRESTESWAAILPDLKGRGLESQRLVVGDGALGIRGGLANVYPEGKEQRCWNHRILNILDKLSKKQQRQGKLILTRIPYAEIREQAEKLQKEFQSWCEKRGAGEAGRLLDHDWERMVAFYGFPKQHWKHHHNVNVIESPFANRADCRRVNGAKAARKNSLAGRRCSNKPAPPPM